MKVFLPVLIGMLIGFALFALVMMTIKVANEMYPEPAKEGCYIGCICA